MRGGGTAVGEVLGGRYLLHERLGTGGMGVVFRATDRSDARTVAVKILRSELLRRPALVARFQAEAHAARRVVHPNVVRVLDEGHAANGRPYLVMELVKGESLSEIARRGAQPLARATDLVRQLLAALADVHAADVVHADVKSDNVLVEATAGGERARLIDFGLARLLDAVGDADLAAAGEGVVSGTPGYMAPEVVRGLPPTPASDLYGAGVVLYELLAGTTPFAGGSSAEVMQRHLDGIVVPPSLRAPERAIPRELDDVVLRALEKDPRRRFASARELADAIAAAMARAAARCPTPQTTEVPPPHHTRESPTMSWRRPRRFARGSAPPRDLRRAVARPRRTDDRVC